MRRESHRTRGVGFALAGDEDGDIEVSRLEAALVIDRAVLSDELANHPDLFYRAALMAARLESRSAVAEMDARQVFVQQVNYLRSQMQDRPQPVTEEQLEARARQAADVDKAARHAAEVRRKFLAARALSAAYEQRGRVLEALSTRLRGATSR